jgi:geranylgeranyl diphosphate synthase type I
VSGPHDDVISRVEDELAGFLDSCAARLDAVGPELAVVADAGRELVLDGGKRLRPLFAYWGWRAVAPAERDDAAVLRAAASLELLHACALVHDDVMDASATRRGRPAVHVAFAEMHRREGWTGDAGAFGRAAAIVLGDLLLSWADAMYTAARLDARARAVYDSMRQLVMAGQYLDVLVQARGQYSASDALRVAQFKTSKYTVEGPLHLGATAAGGTDRTLAALSAYGLPLGEAFQLRDDLLGVFGDPSVTGKPAGDDLLEGKRTLLVAIAMERATPEQAKLLRDGLGDRSLDGAAVAELRAVIEATGAVEEVEQRITARAAQARQALRDDAIRPEAAQVLDDLAVAAVRRAT